MTFTRSRPLRMFSRPPQMLKQVIAGRSWELNSWEASVRPSVARNKGGIYIQRRILSSSFLPRVWAPQIVFKSKTPRGPSSQWKLPRGLLERESRAQAGVCTPPPAPVSLGKACLFTPGHRMGPISHGESNPQAGRGESLPVSPAAGRFPSLSISHRKPRPLPSHKEFLG